MERIINFRQDSNYFLHQSDVTFNMKNNKMGLINASPIHLKAFLIQDAK